MEKKTRLRKQHWIERVNHHVSKLHEERSCSSCELTDALNYSPLSLVTHVRGFGVFDEATLEVMYRHYVFSQQKPAVTYRQYVALVKRIIDSPAA